MPQVPHIFLNALLLSSQAGYRSTGIHGYIYQVLRHLPLAGPDWQYTALVAGGEPPQHPRLGLHRLGPAYDSPPRRILWEQTAQRRLLGRVRPDLYHALAFVSPLGLKIPSLVTVYDLSFMRYPQVLSRGRRLYLQSLTRRSCQQAARVLTISESTAHDLMTFFGLPREKITLAIPGIDPRFRPLPAEEVAAFRQKEGLPERFLLHLGTLEPRKNLALLIRAYAALPQATRQQTPLLLAGGKGWDYADIFATIRRYGLEGQVRHLGYVDSESLPMWYNAALALVYPSLYEGWGLPVAEAMACGLATLVSEVSSLPEAAGQTGYLLPPDQEEAWTAALAHVLEDEAWRARSGQAGLARAGSFTWAATAEAIRGAYQRVLQDQG